MGLDLKRPHLCLLLFFCCWVALSQGTDDAPGPLMNIDTITIESSAKKSMLESNIMDEVAESATKNQGGAKAIKGIKGLKVKGMKPPIVILEFVPKVGMKVQLISEITAAGKSFIGGTMEITVKSNMKTTSKVTVKSETEMNFEVTECTVELISCKTNLPSSMLPKIVNKFLNSTLGKVLPGMMCPAADKVMAHMKEKISSVFQPCECGDGVTMQYLLKPDMEITAETMTIPFKIKMSKNGERMDIPPNPPISADTLVRPPGSAQLIMPVNIISTYMEARQNDFNSNIPCSMGGSSKTVRVERTGPPTVSLEPDKATLTVLLRIEDGANSAEMAMSMDMKFEIQENKLRFILTPGSMDNIQISGSISDEDLKNCMDQYVAVTNEKLAPMCLPSLMGASYEENEIITLENMVLVNVHGS